MKGFSYLGRENGNPLNNPNEKSLKQELKDRLTEKWNTKPKQIKSRPLPNPVIMENISNEQRFLQDLFGGNGTLGRGDNLPKVDGVLINGGGLIKNGDEGRTGNMFGMRRRY